MNLRLTLIVSLCALQANVVAADRCIICSIIKSLTFGLVDLSPDPAWDELLMVDEDDLPEGLILNPICNGLVNVVTNQVQKQIPEEAAGLVDLSSVKCGCDLDGRDLKFGCNLAEPVCLPLDDLGGVLGGGLGGLFDDDAVPKAPAAAPVAAPVGAPVGAVAKAETGTGLKVCGNPMYRGIWVRPRRILGRKPGLKSTACVELTVSGEGSEALSSFSKQLCLKADHVDSAVGTTKIEECSIYVVRKNGDTEECKSCTGCPESDVSIKFDCSNIDLDESADGEFFIPNLGEQCFGAGVLSASDIKTGAKGSYKPLFAPL